MAKYTDNYTWIETNFGSALRLHQDLGKALREAGPVDEKTAELTQLAAAAATRSEGAVHSHVKRALKAGASSDEIYHTLILLISTIGFPTVAAALSWARDIIEG